MQEGKTILREAVRGLRRALFGTAVGRIGVLAVLGLAVVYGMPAKLPDPQPPAVTAKLDVKSDRELAVPPVETPATVASIAPEASPAAAEPQTSENVPAPAVAPAIAPAPAITPPPTRLASLLAEPPPDQFPKSVTTLLPQPKPPLSPAQRLQLQGKDYDRAERCLAQAVYFEARNEAARGQQAVAQVVLNRVFSPHYPKDICSVVYQNAHRHLSCQFTFACDGKADRVSERGAWARANRIAQQTLNARVWLPEVNKATHYHAAYVRPNWIRDMKVMVRYGLHIFYRPRNWGDGSNEAQWGTASNSVKSAAVSAKPATTSRSAHRTGPRRAYARHYRT